MEEKLSFDLMGIQSCQRNRYPLLFVDKITEAIPGKSAKGIKNFTFNEWYFPAHFDDDPNVPGFVGVPGADIPNVLFVYRGIPGYGNQFCQYK